MEQISLTEFVKRQGSIAEAARTLDVPYQTLWRWVNAKSSPSRAMRRVLETVGITSI